MVNHWDIEENFDHAKLKVNWVQLVHDQKQGQSFNLDEVRDTIQTKYN